MQVLSLEYRTSRALLKSEITRPIIGASGEILIVEPACDVNKKGTMEEVSKMSDNEKVEVYSDE